MGSSSYSRDDYAVRSSLRADDAKARGISKTAATFSYDYDIKTGAKPAEVHPSLRPSHAIRESRDSDTHPVAVPIAVFLDLTGSMAEVPILMQEKLTHLMGAFLEDKASGKKYLGEGYPAILIGGVDDFRAQHPNGEGSLQVGQFESGLEIDNNLTNLWLTRNGGGGQPRESYENALYFAAFHTVHDHWEKRGKKGYLFIIGDETAYDPIDPHQIKVLFDDDAKGLSLKDVLTKAQERYHVFVIIPNMTSHFNDPEVEGFWHSLIGENYIKLKDPSKICECIVGAVALCESEVSVDDLSADLHFDTTALVPLSKMGAGISKFSAEGLPATMGATGGIERL